MAKAAFIFRRRNLPFRLATADSLFYFAALRSLNRRPWIRSGSCSFSEEEKEKLEINDRKPEPGNSFAEYFYRALLHFNRHPLLAVHYITVISIKFLKTTSSSFIVKSKKVCLITSPKIEAKICFAERAERLRGTQRIFTNNRIRPEQKLVTVSGVDSAHTSSKDGARFA